MLLHPTMFVLALAPLAQGDPIVLNDDGGWCWFQDPRVIVLDGKLVFGSVASGFLDPDRRGDVEVTSFDLESGEAKRFELHDQLELDDHDVPALIERPDGRLIAMYTKHGTDRLVRVRLSSRRGDIGAWGPEQRIDVGAGVTYSNLFFLSEARDGRGSFHAFHRGVGWDPNVLVSDDLGETWRHRGRVLAGPGRPYVRYASDGKTAVHLIATEQHPRDFDNGIYYGFLRGGVVHESDGTAIGRIATGVDGADDEGVRPEELTRVFAGDAEHVAWTVDLELDADGHPVAVFSVQRDGAGLPPGQGGMDHRFHYARWDGERWDVHEMAFAGTRLYAGEDDYTGLAAIDPDDPRVVFISTDVDPATGEPLVSASDGQRHHELYRGETVDGGGTFTWQAITRHSARDNLRPVVPRWGRERTVVLWLRGTYRSYTDYDLEVVARLE